MASKNCTANRGESLTIYCPECEAETQVVLRTGHGPKGIHIECKKCEWGEKYVRGGYKRFSHKWGKK